MAGPLTKLVNAAAEYESTRLDAKPPPRQPPKRPDESKDIPPEIYCAQCSRVLSTGACLRNA
mgnify:CR=1 FL=1